MRLLKYEGFTNAHLMTDFAIFIYRVQRCFWENSIDEGIAFDIDIEKIDIKIWKKK